MTISYNNNVPAGPNNPSVDQPQMLLNTQAIKAIMEVDHAGFNTAGTDPSGYHEIIHQIEQGTWDAVTRTGAPSATTGFNEVFTLLDTPDAAGAVQDTQLFTVTSNGFISQLTGRLDADEGYVWSGGILFQWGFVSDPTGAPQRTNTVLFKEATKRPGCPPFPKKCFIVIPGLTILSPTPAASVSTNISVNDVSNTKFTYVINTSTSGTFTGFYWIAIGF